MKNIIQKIVADRRGIIMSGLVLWVTVIAIAAPIIFYTAKNLLESGKGSIQMGNVATTPTTCPNGSTPGINNLTCDNLPTPAEIEAKRLADEAARIKQLVEGSAPQATAELNVDGRNAVSDCFPNEDIGACNRRRSLPQFDSSKEIFSLPDSPTFGSWINKLIGSESSLTEIYDFWSYQLKSIWNGIVRSSAPTCTLSTSCINFCKFGGDLENCRTTNPDCSVTLSTKGTSCLPDPNAPATTPTPAPATGGTTEAPKPATAAKPSGGSSAPACVPFDPYADENIGKITSSVREKCGTWNPYIEEVENYSGTEIIDSKSDWDACAENARAEIEKLEVICE